MQKPIQSSLVIFKGVDKVGNYRYGAGTAQDYGMSQFELCDDSVHRRTLVTNIADLHVTFPVAWHNQKNDTIYLLIV